MTPIEVSLPESTTEFINYQVTAGHFATPSEYLGFLVEQARATAARESLDNLLEEGLHSGEPIQFSREWWQQRKAALLATLPV
jgi:antitoxin ParD1/3/4